MNTMNRGTAILAALLTACSTTSQYPNTISTTPSPRTTVAAPSPQLDHWVITLGQRMAAGGLKALLQVLWSAVKVRAHGKVR